MASPARATDRRTADDLLDQALDRMRVLVDAVLAVRAVHAPVPATAVWRRRSTLRCCGCGAVYPCRTVLALTATRLPAPRAPTPPMFGSLAGSRGRP